MKYGEVVRDLAARGGNWRYYDTNFRYLKQQQPASLAWNEVPGSCGFAHRIYQPQNHPGHRMGGGG